MFEVLVKNGKVISSGQAIEADIGIEEGKIIYIGKQFGHRSAGRIIDAKGKYILPGIVDEHVHMGSHRSFEEDAKVVMRACALGGITTLNIVARCTRMRAKHTAISSTADVVSYSKVFEEADSMVKRNSLCDYTFTFTIMKQDHADEIPKYVDMYGVTTFKFYMQDRIVDDFMRKVGRPIPFDDGILYLGFQEIAKKGPPAVALLHCENPEIIRFLRKKLKDSGRKDLAAWEESRPGFGEADYVRRAIFYSRLTGCPIHIFHISSREAIEEVATAKAEGVKITAETLTKQLALTKHDKAGTALKAMPPVRGGEHVEALWMALRDGTIDCIGSDFVVAPADERLPISEDVWKATAGAGNSQTFLPVMLSEGVN